MLPTFDFNTLSTNILPIGLVTHSKYVPVQEKNINHWKTYIKRWEKYYDYKRQIANTLGIDKLFCCNVTGNISGYSNSVQKEIPGFSNEKGKYEIYSTKKEADVIYEKENEKLKRLYPDIIEYAEAEGFIDIELVKKPFILVWDRNLTSIHLKAVDPIKILDLFKVDERLYNPKDFECPEGYIFYEQL